ncbi:MAG: glycosyltransferase [Bacteroidales bacterium]|nr:glycosyltransferase [Bacteroidales bacterium]MBN2757794.1 glycosyltransferase [Bacteroidales bacterium]
MHILIIPSEQYIPDENSLQGIFQRDQALILKSKGFKIGIISVSLKYSVIMLLKAIFFKLIRIDFENDLKQKDFKFIFKTLFFKTFSIKKYIKIDEVDDIPVIRIESSYQLFLSSKNEYKGWIKGGLKAFEKYIYTYGKPDIIHAHNMVYAGILSSKIKKKYNIPVVVTEHSSYYYRELYGSFTLSKIEKSFYNLNELITVSESLSELLYYKFKESKSYKYIPNVLDNDFINAPMVKSDKEGFVFINIGTFIEIKGQADLINAFSNKFKGTNVKLKIIGGGLLQNELIKLTFDLGIQNQVEIIVQLSRQDIIKQLDNADVFVFSSKYETFGVAIIEALARGLPVISTKCGGPESIINDTNGILVENGDIDSLAKGMRFIYNNLKIFNRENIRNNCIDIYGEKMFSQKIKEVYTNILANA